MISLPPIPRTARSKRRMRTASANRTTVASRRWNLRRPPLRAQSRVLNEGLQLLRLYSSIYNRATIPSRIIEGEGTTSTKDSRGKQTTASLLTRASLSTWAVGKAFREVARSLHSPAWLALRTHETVGRSRLTKMSHSSTASTPLQLTRYVDRASRVKAYRALGPPDSEWRAVSPSQGRTRTKKQMQMTDMT